MFFLLFIYKIVSEIYFDFNIVFKNSIFVCLFVAIGENVKINIWFIKLMRHRML